MSRDKQRLPDYLQHILDAIRRIGRYTANMDKAAFKANELVCDAVIRNVEIIGEASNNVDKHYRDFAEAHPELPWADAYEMRNAVAHGYFNVDLDIVWDTVRNDLPGLHMYLAGAAAGYAKAHILSCLAAMPVPEAIRYINACPQGVR